MSQTPPDDTSPEFGQPGPPPPDDNLLDDREPPDLRDEYASRARRRAALTLVVLAVAAALIAGFVSTLGRGLHTPAARRPAPVASETSSAPSSSRPVASPRRTTATTPPAPVGATSCAPTPCVLAGDAGLVVAAINAYRAAGAAPPVTGSASSAAASCAINNGNSQSCPGSYYWTPVSALRGSEVVSKIAGYGNGRTWLLNPGLTRVAIGCAQTGPSGYECAVVDAGAR